MYLLVIEFFDNHPVGYMAYSVEELNNLPTRKLLKVLRDTNKWDYGPYGGEGYTRIHKYQYSIRKILSTREHIPNKQESKQLRKLRKKRGYR